MIVTWHLVSLGWWHCIKSGWNSYPL